MSDQNIIQPRLLTKEQAAAYAAGGSIRRFDRWRKAGMMPPRVPGTTLFDRLALDAAIDKLSGFSAAKVNAAAPPAEDPFEKWRKRYEERRAARKQAAQSRTPRRTPSK